jgi:hypothetical protein
MYTKRLNKYDYKVLYDAVSEMLTETILARPFGQSKKDMVGVYEETKADMMDRFDRTFGN